MAHSVTQQKRNCATSQCLNYHCSHISPRQQNSFVKLALNQATNQTPGHFSLQLITAKYDQKFPKMLNVISGFESNLLIRKAGKLPKALWQLKKSNETNKQKNPKPPKTKLKKKKRKEKNSYQPSTSYFIFTLPHSCQVNLISLCFMKNPKNSPKAILYSQKVLNKYTLTITCSYFFGPIKMAPVLHLFCCCVHNMYPDGKSFGKTASSFLISKMFPHCPYLIHTCATTLSLHTILTLLQLPKKSLSCFFRPISVNF